MSRDLRWYLNRLRAMSVAEVAHRSYRAARYPLDQLRMRTGLYARPSAAMRAHLNQWQGPEPFYFDKDLVKTPVSPELRQEAEEICAGKRRVLGLGWIDFPEHGWHYEPNAKAYWPLVDAARVVRSAPAHFDPRLTWEFNRGHEWVVLARVYASTREPQFLDQLVRELASWRRANPPGHGINWTSAMEAAIRIHSLVWCAGFLRGNAVVIPTLAEALYEHATFVADHRSYFSSANNHLLVELSALIVAALTVGGEFHGLHAPALSRLLSELDRQIYPDGVNAEMATHYHVFVLEALLLVAHLQRTHANPAPRLEIVIHRMADYLAAIRCGDGSLLQQGDNDDGRILAFFHTRHADQLLTAAAALAASPPRGEAIPPPASEGAFWLTGGASHTSLVEPPTRSRCFADSRQVVLRSARLLASLDAGPFGFGSLAAHAHCDALSLILAVDGHRVLVDRGTYRYNGNLCERNRYRMTAAHNTVQLGHCEQAIPNGPFLWSHQPKVVLERCDLLPDGDIIQASHEGFGAWQHHRTVIHHAGILVLIDSVEGAFQQASFTSRFHFDPALRISATSPTDFLVEFDVAPLVWFRTSTETSRLITWPHSDIYAGIGRGSTLEADAPCNARLLTAIGPLGTPAHRTIPVVAQFASTHGISFDLDGLRHST